MTKDEALKLVEEKIIFGLANANSAFVHNSIWLNILPIFYINENYFRAQKKTYRNFEKIYY